MWKGTCQVFSLFYGKGWQHGEKSSFKREIRNKICIVYINRKVKSMNDNTINMQKLTIQRQRPEGKLKILI